RMGRNPQNAPAWLFGLVIVAGILLIGLTRWTIDAVHRLANAEALGTEGIVLTLVGWVFGLMMIALIVRVVASWVGVSEYARWMRPVVLLTEWLLGPIRRRMPPLGMVDLSPLVAYFVLIVLRIVVTGLLAAVL
ncbi:MAG: YggT family protein, partial [Gemmatimonadota bacterium]|nr:YggT family protein [Gemmatimonadota bacterium]